MKILCTNNTLALLAGSETFTYTLSVALKRLGHQVACYSRRLGQVSARLEEENILSVSDFSLLPWKPDVIHAHHAAGLEAHQRFPDVPTVFVSNGIIPQERPGFSPSKLVAVSEEVRQALFPRVTDCIIRNAVDTERFSTYPIATRKVLFVSNYASGREAQTVERAARAAGYEFDCLGLRFGIQNWNIEEEYAKAAIVVALGRTALEAMAMGRNVVVFDAGHPIDGVPQLRGDGLVAPETYPEIRKHNFSGRRWNRVRDWRALSEEFKKATPENARWSAEIVRQEHDMGKAAKEYEELYVEVCN